ncbi:MAG: 1-deoxy-D-xylulose-5-phosphate synthase N-terminal domain-containing protein, partial [Acidimicrobiales bacterium]
MWAGGTGAGQEGVTTHGGTRQQPWGPVRPLALRPLHRAPTAPGAPPVILERIECPADLRALSSAELEALAEEIRAFIVEAVSRT